jgi:phage gp45-like
VFRGEVKEGVELLLPPGMSAVPLGGDALLFQVNGRRDHVVALVDDPSTRIADLKAGEFGFRDQMGQQVVFRADHLEITTPRKVVITATGDVVITHPLVIKTTFLLYFATPASIAAACDAMDVVSIIGLWKLFV